MKVLKENWRNYPNWQDVIGGAFVVDHATILNDMPGFMCWPESPYTAGLYFLMDEHLIRA